MWLVILNEVKNLIFTLGVVTLLRPDASLRSSLQLNCVTNKYNFDRLICSGRTQRDSMPTENRTPIQDSTHCANCYRSRIAAEAFRRGHTTSMISVLPEPPGVNRLVILFARLSISSQRAASLRYIRASATHTDVRRSHMTTCLIRQSARFSLLSVDIAFNAQQS